MSESHQTALQDCSVPIMQSTTNNQTYPFKL